MRLVLDIQGSHAQGFWEDEHGDRKAAYVTTLGIDRQRDYLYRSNISTMRFSVELVMSDLEVASRTALADEGLGISPEPAHPYREQEQRRLIEQALETTEGRVALAQAMVEPILRMSEGRVAVTRAMVEPMLRMAEIYRATAGEIGREMLPADSDALSRIAEQKSKPLAETKVPSRWDLLP